MEAAYDAAMVQQRNLMKAKVQKKKHLKDAENLLAGADVWLKCKLIP
jgi:hypothetical protein